MAKDKADIKIEDLKIEPTAVSKAEIATSKTSVTLRKEATDLKKLGKLKEAAEKYAEAALKSEVPERANLYIKLCNDLDPKLASEVAQRLSVKRINDALLARQGTRNPSEM